MGGRSAVGLFGLRRTKRAIQKRISFNAPVKINLLTDDNKIRHVPEETPLYRKCKTAFSDRIKNKINKRKYK